MPDGIVTCNVGAQSGDVGPFRPSPAADDQTKYESQQEDHQRDHVEGKETTGEI